MKETFFNLKNTLFGRRNQPRYEGGAVEKSHEGDYVELDSSAESTGRQRVAVKQFVMEDFEDIKPVLDCLRNGSTIALINIAPLKNKDIVELKRAVNKLKKTCDALEGDLAGFGEDYIVATPEFAYVQRNKSETPSATDNIEDDDEM